MGTGQSEDIIPSTGQSTNASQALCNQHLRTNGDITFLCNCLHLFSSQGSIFIKSILKFLSNVSDLFERPLSALKNGVRRGEIDIKMRI